jgi:hypothetical protein
MVTIPHYFYDEHAMRCAVHIETELRCYYSIVAMNSINYKLCCSGIEKCSLYKTMQGNVIVQCWCINKANTTSQLYCDSIKFAERTSFDGIYERLQSSSVRYKLNTTLVRFTFLKTLLYLTYSYYHLLLSINEITKIISATFPKIKLNI